METRIATMILSYTRGAVACSACLLRGQPFFRTTLGLPANFGVQTKFMEAVERRL